MFAASKGAGKPVSAQVFTANGTFVVPAGVTKINMSGFGSPAVGDTPVFRQVLFVGAINDIFTASTSPYAQWGDVFNALSNAISVINSNSGINLVTLDELFYIVDPTDAYDGGTNPIEVYIDGSANTNFRVNNAPFSGNILYSQLSGFTGWSLHANTFDAGVAGSAATGVGNTFPGGTLTGTYPFQTAVAAPTTTFNNVTVTPGASYPIVVPSGGSITISYFV
jgi:hypothetical protein